MTLAAILAELAKDSSWAVPDLLTLGRAVFDAIERKNQASTINAELAGVDAAADAAERAKVGP